MSSVEEVVYKIGRNYWTLVPKNTTHTSRTYPLKDVIEAGGEIPNWVSSD